LFSKLVSFLLLERNFAFENKEAKEKPIISYHSPPYKSLSQRSPVR
jgi:hypothetical protein